MDNSQSRPRIVLLYRASSKKQTDSENDIPLQRNILKPWAERQGVFIKEFVEGGVSGFKVSATKRDAVIEIKAMADRHEFDILGIYMSERLGRIADETPLIVSYLNARGIKVISYNEGEISAKTHSDKLMTYIRYWQAEGESLKTSARCADAIEQCVRNGVWPGGPAPFGYCYVSRGTLNYKGKPIFDLEIHPEYGQIVKDLFRMYGKEHYGTRLLAKALNDKGILTQNGVLWNSSHLSRLLRNKTYAGYYVLHEKSKSKESIESPHMPKIQIVSLEDWQEVQRQLDKNKGTQRPPTRYGTLLLTGFTYCGQCGEKITSCNSIWEADKGKPVEERRKKHMYRCRTYFRPKTDRPTCKPSMWTASKIDELVISDAKQFIRDADKEQLLNSHESELNTRLKEIAVKLERYESEVGKKEREIKKIKDEIMKTLLGESAFNQTLLSEMLRLKESELIGLKQKYTEAQEEVFEIERILSMQRIVREEMAGWSEKFDTLSTAGKKAMLINIIDRITIYPEVLEVIYKVQLDIKTISNDDEKQKPKTVSENDPQNADFEGSSMPLGVNWCPIPKVRLRMWLSLLKQISLTIGNTAGLTA